jgi:hypothetical protein
MQRRILSLLVGIVFVGVLAATGAWAGSPHFVSINVDRTDDSLCLLAKEAGLGDEAQVHIVLSATALCINGGGNHPKAVNKESVSSGGDFPVQNGHADVEDQELCVTATFQPPCSPPMTVEFTNVVVQDTTNGLTVSFPGTF